MFEDFDQSKTVDEGGRRRLRVSATSAVILYGALAGTAAVLGSRAPEVREEQAVVVEFAPPPPAPEPEEAQQEPEPEAPQNFDSRPLAAREEMLAPEEVPDEQLAESDEPLALAEGTGPISGSLTGTGGGGLARQSDGPRNTNEAEEPERPAAPEEEEDQLLPPRQTGGCRSPDAPPEARTQGLTGTVRVRVVIGEDGTIVSIDILSGDPVFHPNVRRCVESTTWEAAHFSDGTTVRMSKTLTFAFRSSNL